jgi:hydroxybutyrate-dimer hydrolase
MKSVLLLLFVPLLGASLALADDRPPIERDSLRITIYDGVSDDLLSAGLNLEGLVSNVPPGFADQLNPTPAELRRRAIYNNYRAIVDPVPAGPAMGPAVAGNAALSGRGFRADPRSRVQGVPASARRRR